MSSIYSILKTAAYRRLTGLVKRALAVAALPVGGSYSLNQWQRFAETLPQVLPVRLVRRGEVTEARVRHQPLQVVDLLEVAA